MTTVLKSEPKLSVALEFLGRKYTGNIKKQR